MRNLLVLVILIIQSYSLAQLDSVIIYKSVDEMSDKVYYMPSRALVLRNDDKTIGVRLDLNFNKEVQPTTIMAELINIGSCSENDELIIMFEDSTKLKFKSYASFNCEGNAYFRLEKSDIKKFREFRIIKLKITNGRSYESFTKEIGEERRDYFKQVMFAAENKKIKPYPKEK